MATTPFDLPQLLVKETQQVQRAAIVEEDFTPMPITTNPAIDGHREGTAAPGPCGHHRKGAEHVLLASRQDPVLSEWQFGLGRVMAWTSDAKNIVASRWLE